MTGYVVRRLIGLVPVLFAAATLVWVLMFIIPGDPARLIAGSRALDPDVIDAVRAEWGLDRPVPVQYLAWLGKILRGDLGTSYLQRRPVTEILGDHFVPTLILAVAAVALSAAAGIALGTLAALSRSRFAVLMVDLLALVGASTPVFWIGLMLMLLFGARLGWLPVLGYGDAGAILPGTRIRLPEWDHLVLPALTLSLMSAGAIARLTLSGLDEAGGGEYLRTAAAKGASRFRVLAGHALRNALIPVVTVIGLGFAGLLGGAVATEYVFAWPGLGKTVVRSIALKDLPVVEGCVLFLAGVAVLASLAVDLVYALIDPRIQPGPAGDLPPSLR
jgi:ABC-type dipeptide/oligopeptide/nickel transport system permease component